MGPRVPLKVVLTAIQTLKEPKGVTLKQINECINSVATLDKFVIRKTLDECLLQGLVLHSKGKYTIDTELVDSPKFTEARRHRRRGHRRRSHRRRRSRSGHRRRRRSRHHEISTDVDDSIDSASRKQSRQHHRKDPKSINSHENVPTETNKEQLVNK